MYLDIGSQLSLTSRLIEKRVAELFRLRAAARLAPTGELLPVFFGCGFAAATADAAGAN